MLTQQSKLTIDQFQRLTQIFQILVLQNFPNGQFTFEQWCEAFQYVIEEHILAARGNANV